MGGLINIPFEGPHILGLSDDFDNRLLPLSENVVSIGRDLTCDICIESYNISRHHAEIRRNDEGDFILRDLGSANGCFVNDMKVAEHALALDDRLRFDVYEFVYLDPARTSVDLSCRPLRYLDAALVGRLVPVSGLAGPAHVLRGQTTTIGSGSFNDMVVPDDAVSTNHCKVKNDDGTYTVVDLKSTNGTWINGTRVDREGPIRVGDELTLGKVVVCFDLVKRPLSDRARLNENRTLFFALFAAGLLAIVGGAFLFALALVRLFSDAPPFGPLRKLEVKPLWVSQATGTIPPCLIDLDGDGACEVILAGPGRRVHCLDGSSGQALWSFRAIDTVRGVSGLAAARRRPALVLVATEGAIHALDAEARIRWETPFGDYLGRVMSPAVSAPWGAAHTIAFATTAGTWHVLGSSDGRLAANGGPFPCSFVHGPVLSDIVDGMPYEIVVVDHAGTVRAATVDGNLLWQARGAAPGAWSPVIGDLDGDGTDEVVVVGPRYDSLIVFDSKQGKVLGRVKAPGRLVARPGLAELSPKPGLELVLPLASGKVVCLRFPDEEVLYQTKVLKGSLPPVPLAIFDFNRDHVDDFCVANASGTLTILDGLKGEPLAKATSAAGPLAGPFVLGDINGDSRLDFVVRLSDGRLASFTTNRPGRKGFAPWPSLLGTPSGTGNPRP